MKTLMKALALCLALVVSLTAPADAGKKPIKAVPGSNAYGWNWDHPVSVYDGTNNPDWDVAGATQKWSLYGLSLYLTTDEASADIVVTEGDANAMCGVSEPIIGCGNTTVDANNEPIHGTIVMSAYMTNTAYKDTLVGGTLHEMGHTLGFGHPAGLTNADSVMGTPIPANCNPCARTTLSSFDRGGVRYLY